MSETPDMFSEESTSFSEFGAGGMHRIHSSRNIKTLENVKEALQSADLSPEKIKDFLQDTNNSVSFDFLGNEDFTNPQRLEKMIYKQQFLENNNLFNPTKYFGGVEVTSLEDHVLDQKLDYMFLDYLPTEMEEQSDNENKAIDSKKPKSNTIVTKQVSTPLVKIDQKYLHNKMPTPPSKYFSKTSSQHKKSSSRISMKNVNGSVDLKSTLESRRNNPSKITSMSERMNSIDKKNQFSNSTAIKSLNRDNTSLYNIKPKELSIDFNKSKNIISPVCQNKSNMKNIVKNNITSSSFVSSIHDKENIVHNGCSPVKKNSIKDSNIKGLSIQSKDIFSNYKNSQKKSSSFVTHFFEVPSHCKFGPDLSSHPRTENPSFVENDLNRSTSNLNCARVLRTTNDTDKENEPPNKMKQTKSPASTYVKKYKNSISIKPKKQIESPFCHLKMPKRENFFESKKRMNSTSQRLATQY